MYLYSQEYIEEPVVDNEIVYVERKPLDKLPPGVTED